MKERGFKTLSQKEMDEALSNLKQDNGQNKNNSPKNNQSIEEKERNIL